MRRDCGLRLRQRRLDGIFLVNGSTLEDYRAGKCHPSKLYRNNHDGSFIDVTAKAGLAACNWGFGVAVGDYDNDGWEDIYVTNLNGAVLYHNNHDGTFSDITVKAGVGNPGAGEQARLSATTTMMGCSTFMLPTTSISISTIYPSSAKVRSASTGEFPFRVGRAGSKAAGTACTTTMATAPSPM